MAEIFGRYELIRRLGSGGMAEVFMGRNFGPAGFVKDVVIKRILPTFNEDPEFVRMFINEARLAAQLQHANIVQIYDFDHVDGVYYIAMEWVQGTDLKRVATTARRRAMPLPRSMAVHVGVEALKGLHYAHTKTYKGRPLNLVHRDISPHNMLVSFSGELKITDFGIAKVAALASTTQVGTVKGKLPYMSPEQIRSDGLDARSDIFSLGIVLWEMLVGERLYQASSEPALIQLVRDAEVPSLRERRPDLPEDLVAVVMKMLAPDQEQRYPTAKAALGDLSRFAGVEDGLVVAEYLRKLLPEEALADRRGDTLPEADPDDSAQIVTPGLPDSPTHTHDPEVVVPVVREEQSDRPSERPAAPDGGDHSSSTPAVETGSDPAAESAAAGDGERLAASGRRTVAVALLLCALLFGAAGYVLAEADMPSVGGETGTHARSSAELTIATEPAGAEVWVDGVPLGPAPRTIAAEWGGTVTVEARRGDDRVSQQITLGSGTEPRLTLELPRAAVSSVVAAAGAARPADGGAVNPGASPAGVSAPLPTTAPSAAPPPPVTTGATAARGAGDKAVPAPAAPPASPPARAKPTPRRKTRGFGTISVHVAPWAEVKVDGRSVGQTPLNAHKLSAGRHTIVLRNRPLGKRERIVVEVKPGRRSATIRRNWTR